MSAALPESAHTTQIQDAFNAAAEALMTAGTTPGAADLAGALRLLSAVGDHTSLDERTRADILDVRARLLAESSPDYWLDVVGVPLGDIDSVTAQMATDAADSRRQQALLLTGLLERFEDPTDLPVPQEA